MLNLTPEMKETISPQGLLSAPATRQRERGYFDTLREIWQQPATWLATSDLLHTASVHQQLSATLSPRPTHVVLTGSGSSIYAGECVAPCLQLGLGLPVQSIPAGTLLTHWSSVLPPGEGLLISLARSGDSPESCAVIDQLLAGAPAYRHLVITCNATGKLATSYRGDPRVTVLVLDERTNDRSLVMTSSFTNMVLACTGLLQPDRDTIQPVARLADAVQHTLDEQAGSIAAVAGRDFRNVIYLGSGGALGAAHESALKMLEMTNGAVFTAAETYLGLRHGPMSSVDEKTLVVGFLSSTPAIRAYETDLLDELAHKRLGMARVLVGHHIPGALLSTGDVAVAQPAPAGDDDVLPLLADVVVGQMLAFFRCLALGGRPDTPSKGVLTRVVGRFPLH